MNSNPPCSNSHIQRRIEFIPNWFTAKRHACSFKAYSTAGCLHTPVRLADADKLGQCLREPPDLLCQHEVFHRLPRGDQIALLKPLCPSCFWACSQLQRGWYLRCWPWLRRGNEAWEILCYQQGSSRSMLLQQWCVKMLVHWYIMFSALQHTISKNNGFDTFTSKL